MWIKAFPPVGKGYSNPAASWSWAAWIKCSISAAVGGCLASTGVCALSGPGYGGCVAIGCGGSAVAGMAGCAVSQLLDGWF